MTTLAKARFAQIVLPRIDEGYRLARWLTGSATDAEDVMQEACLKAYRAIENFAEGNARAWFLTIVRNVAYSWLQRHRPAKFVSLEDVSLDLQLEIETGGLMFNAVPTPEDALLDKQRAAELQGAVEELPLHLRETVVLREFHGLSYREIASISKVPIGTVMSRLAKARQSLISRLKEIEH
ncbi:RNA polymerase sigma-70 factor, ECF subfamily [Rhizobium sp. NFR07]|uniref:sigma-70 family RNA polymerase sigma factor n=1 Tax=Rhizobium sp. NFR07 TaxID=1566262 RepID=UPI0008F0AA50|nr:sigma-70 family RNA polymerase sigma factor [Rhizobium sp. NFR07]SFB34470.1 RNA polymerase sigma-70 factor, ECF subfamily [Rhizobium sp. NFR07]